MMPAFLLKRQIMMNLPCENLEPEVANSIDFMVERVNEQLSLLTLGAHAQRGLRYLSVVFVC